MKFLRKSPRTNLMKGYVCSGGWHKILHDTPRHTMTHHDTPWHTMTHHDTWHTMTHHDTPWHTKTYHDTPWHTMTQGRMWVMVEWIAEARDLQGWPFFSLDISDVTDAGNICVSWGPNWGTPPLPPRWYHTAVMFEGFQGCPPIWVSWCAESP